MTRAILPRCPNHTTAAPSTCSRCRACCDLRGTIPSPRKPGTTGAERHRQQDPARRKLTRALASVPDVAVEDVVEVAQLLDRERLRLLRRHGLGPRDKRRKGAGEG